MKKFIILLMSIVLLFSVFAMSACDSGDTGEVNSSSETSSEEESSSLGKVSRNFGGGSSNADTETSGGNGFIPTTSSGGNGTTSVPEVSFSGDSFYAPETVAPEGTSPKAAMLIMQISYIEVTPSNYETVEATIKEAEDFFNALTASEKEEVINYNDLVAAREALNNIKAAGSLAKFEQLMSTLPEPNVLKNANVDAVYQAKELLDSNEAYFQANCASFTSYKTKLTDCYNKVISSIVESAYIAQDGNGNGIMEDVVTVGKKTYSETGSSGYEVKKRGNNYPTVSNPFNISDSVSDGNETSYHMYSDTKNTNVKIWQYTNFTTFTFTTDAPGTLCLYFRLKKVTYTVTSNSGTETCNATESLAYFEIPVSGTVTVSSDGAGYLCAVKFSYPNLG